jgi:succinate dehydrogenase / fumarate reductase cytochrome b subunit
MHRISGVILYFGSFLLLAWYISILIGAETYQLLNQLFSFSIIKIALFLFTWIFFHHLFGGIRHFIWDTGRGFELTAIEWLARLTAIFSLISTLIVWFL